MCPQAAPVALAGAAADARGCLPERRVRECVQGFVQLAQLAGEERESLLLLGRAVHALELGCDPVQPLEQRVELAVGDVLVLHRAQF